MTSALKIHNFRPDIYHRRSIHATARHGSDNHSAGLHDGMLL